MIMNYNFKSTYMKDSHLEPFAEDYTVLIFLIYVVLLNTMIPISLIVSLEIVKFVQAIFIRLDEDMINSNGGCTVQTTVLNEELG